MIYLLYLVIFFISIQLLLYSSAADLNEINDSFTVGAVEFNPWKGNCPENCTQSNLNSYLEFIGLAKTKRSPIIENPQNVDVLIFPEATFNYFDTRDNNLARAIQIPEADKKIAPCDYPNEYSNELISLSKAARDSRIYLLVNIVEKASCSINPKICERPYNTHSDGYSLYNTNVVFDRYGRIISKYRKINLFNEPAMDVPLGGQSLAVFDTDFNVKFGHMICFDIFFKHPATALVEQAGVKHILHPTYWYTTMPFFSATAIQQGWAYANNVNLIVAGANNPSSGTTGTGVYLGRDTIELMAICPISIRKLYTVRVPKAGNPKTRLRPNVVDENCRSANMLQMSVNEDWANEDRSIFDLKDSPQSICVDSERICCTMEFKMNERPIPPGKLTYRYAVAINYTNVLYGRTRNLGEIHCAVLTCTGRSSKTCGRRFKSNNVFQAREFENFKIMVKIRSTSFDNVLIMPNTLTTDFHSFHISDYNFKSSNIYKEKGHSYKEFTITAHQKLPDFLVFGIYGRDFGLDKQLHN